MRSARAPYKRKRCANSTKGSRVHMDRVMGKKRAALVAVAGAWLIAVSALPAWAGAENWNDQEVHWMSYDEGLAAAKKEHRPICLIFYTTWCPHCANYS